MKAYVKHCVMKKNIILGNINSCMYFTLKFKTPLISTISVTYLPDTMVVAVVQKDAWNINLENSVPISSSSEK